MIRSLTASVVAGAALAVTIAAVPASAAPCTSQNAGWRYKGVTKQSIPLSQVGGTYSNYNGTRTTADMTLTSTTSGTVGMAVSMSASAEIKTAILGGVKAELGVSVSASMTATSSNTSRITVPAQRTGNGAYGVYRLKASGHLYRVDSCGRVLEDRGTVTSLSPKSIGWRTWIS